ARRVRVESMTALATLITSLSSREAIALGALGQDLPETVEVVTADKLNGLTGAIARTKAFLRYDSSRAAFALLDFDKKQMPREIAARIEMLGGFWGALVTILPELENAAHLVRGSTSSGLYRTDTGERFPGGEHAYVRVRDGADIPRFLADLY